jgi:type IV pilus assembly protein PilB
MGNVLTVAMADPLNVNALDEVRYITKAIIKRAVAGKKEIEAAIDQYYSVAESVRNIVGKDEAESEALSGAEVTEADSLQVPGTVVQLVDLLIRRAIKDRASDIHIEPDSDVLRVRYRVNGVMREEASPPRKLQAEIVSRIKVAANLDVSEKRLPQDGRMTFGADDGPVDLRISTLPTIHGEKVVIRILDRKNLRTGLEQLGMRSRLLENWRMQIKKAEGLLLLTGPTSSGKTSTLYASLCEINSVEKNIITVEDPVEYSLSMINQIQINERSGLSFAAALRSILRQNPDVIMIGEIRDTETAAIAIRAALTGHLVFSTLHTNDAIATISRLIDMGIEPYLVSSALEASLAQRLVRTICPECKEPTDIPASMLGRVFPEGHQPNATFYRGKGCRHCRNTGFAGQTGLFEMVEMTEVIRDMILRRESEAAVRGEAGRALYQPLFDTGLELVVQGITTLDEVLRVTTPIESYDSAPFRSPVRQTI